MNSTTYTIDDILQLTFLGIQLDPIVMKLSLSWLALQL